MRKLTLFLLFFVGLSLALPTLAQAEMSAEKVAKKVKIIKGGDPKVLDFKGPPVEKGLFDDTYYLRSFFDTKYGVVSHFIVYEYDFLKSKGSGDGQWRRDVDEAYKGFYKAVDYEGNEFELHVFHRDFDGCGDNSFCRFDEYFRITLSDEYVRSKAAGGIHLKAVGKGGRYLEVNIYPAYVQGILARLQQERDKRGLAEIN